jgi:hypothetical protein
VNVKPSHQVLTNVVSTWLTKDDYVAIVQLAKENGVSAAAYFRAVLIDAIQDEKERSERAIIVMQLKKGD